MPPKKAASKAKSNSSTASKAKSKSSTASSKSTKRKQPPTASETSKPTKSPRKSARTSKDVDSASSKAAPSVPTPKLLNFLLSTRCRAHTTPKDEAAAVAADPSLRSYTNTIPLTPFEELFSALVLSRPISHALGQRSIRTLLNPPYNFRTPRAILDAGPEKVHKSLFAARTQHKGKTAEQIGLLAEVVIDKFAAGDGDAREDDQSLGRMRSQVDGDTDEVTKILSDEVKGMGATAAKIFLRRIQAVWAECYPYMDDRTGQSLEKMGLPSDEDKLVKAIDDNWNELNHDNLSGSSDEEKKRIAYTLVLERAIGADLNGGITSLLEEAADTSKTNQAVDNMGEEEEAEVNDTTEAIRSFDLSSFRYQSENHA